MRFTKKRVVKIPTPRVTEKPLTGPEPIKNNINAAIKVVILASSIVVLDFVYPESKAIIGLLPFVFARLAYVRRFPCRVDIKSIHKRTRRTTSNHKPVSGTKGKNKRQ